MTAETDRITNDLGRSIFVLRDDPRSKVLAETQGNFNPDSRDLWNATLELGASWDLTLDIGANYGEMLAGIRRPPGGRVVALDANPAVVRALKQTCGELPFEVEIIETAVSSVAGPALAFAVDKHWSGTSHLATDLEQLDPDRYDIVPVTVASLDSLFSPVESIAIKLDVEGAEDQVLRGGNALFTTSARTAVMLEILHLPVQRVWRLQQESPLFLWNLKRQTLVRVIAKSAEELGILLHSGVYYRQDAVLIMGTDGPAFTREIQECFGTTAQIEHSAKNSVTQRLELYLFQRDEQVADLQKNVADLERQLTQQRHQVERLELEALKNHSELEQQRRDSAAAQKILRKKLRRVGSERDALRERLVIKVADRLGRLRGSQWSERPSK